MYDVRTNAPIQSNRSSLLDGLEAYWKLEGADGTDATGNGNTLTFDGSPGSRSGKINNALDLVAASSQCAKISKATIGTVYGGDDFTIAGWALRDVGVSTSTIASVYGGTADISWMLQLASNFRFFASTDGAATSNTGFVGANPGDSTWFHWLIQWDESANEFDLMINGSSVATLSPPGTGIFDAASDLTLGKRGDGASSHDGGLDEVGVWSRLLTSEEITILAAASKTHPFN